MRMEGGRKRKKERKKERKKKRMKEREREMLDFSFFLIFILFFL